DRNADADHWWEQRQCHIRESGKISAIGRRGVSTRDTLRDSEVFAPAWGSPRRRNAHERTTAWEEATRDSVGRSYPGSALLRDGHESRAERAAAALCATRAD